MGHPSRTRPRTLGGQKMGSFGIKVHNLAPFDGRPLLTREYNQMATYIHGLDGWIAWRCDAKPIAGPLARMTRGTRCRADGPQHRAVDDDAGKIVHRLDALAEHTKAAHISSRGDILLRRCGDSDPTAPHPPDGTAHGLTRAGKSRAALRGPATPFDDPRPYGDQRRECWVCWPPKAGTLPLQPDA